jgi:hypothetical protein
MDPSLLLARLIGPLFMAAGAGLLLNPEHYRRMLHSFLADAALYYFSGALALTAGVAILLFHNLWVADWRVAITVLGWLSLLKGLARLLFPQAGQRFAGLLDGRATLVGLGVLILLLGAWLGTMGYLA